MASVTASGRRPVKRRQSLRKGLILVSFLLFPITINYFSPYLIIESASAGIVNGSFVVFAAMFVSSLVLGRLWCGWACPGAGVQEALFAVNGSRVAAGKWDLAKWIIWVPWIAGIAAAAISAGGYGSVQFFYNTENGISVDRPAGYVIYYGFVGLLVALSLLFGRRAGCHYICWMAPFMMLGRAIGDRLRIPALRLKADGSACESCGTCSKGCPMSLDVQSMVRAGSLHNSECTLCGTCADGCPRHVIGYGFGTRRSVTPSPR